MYEAFKVLPTTKRPITASPVKYQLNGTGRDFYINGTVVAHNKINYTKARQRSQNSSYQPRIVHYQSQGRDSYIKCNDGGLSYDPIPFDFPQILRKPYRTNRFSQQIHPEQLNYVKRMSQPKPMLKAQTKLSFDYISHL